MSEENTSVEQITKEPEQKIERVKDPKKVAAGKRLAEYHKKAKQALKQEKEHDKVDEEDNSDSKWMPNISLTTALSLVGITLTAVDLYFRWRKNNNKDTTIPKPKIENYEEKENKVTKPVTQQSKIPKRKIGME